MKEETLRIDGLLEKIVHGNVTRCEKCGYEEQVKNIDDMPEFGACPRCGSNFFVGRKLTDRF